MTKRQLMQAARKHRMREQAKRAEAIMVPGYPYSHNPYIPHEPLEDCYGGCVHSVETGK